MGLRMGLGAMALLLLMSSTASAALITFDTRAAFDAQAGVLPIETFEEGGVVDGDLVACPGTLTSTTNNHCFASGDILPGLTLQSGTFQPDSGLVLVGAGFAGSSKSVLANFPWDSLDLFFDDASSVGFDLVVAGYTAVTLSVFGAGGALLDTFESAYPGNGTFFGVINTSGVITRINVAAIDPVGEGVDNLAFGPAVPEPASGALLAMGLVGLAAARRRARR